MLVENDHIVHYENVDPEKNIEKSFQNCFFENMNNLENMIHFGTADHWRCGLCRLILLLEILSQENLWYFEKRQTCL